MLLRISTSNMALTLIPNARGRERSRGESITYLLDAQWNVCWEMAKRLSGLHITATPHMTVWCCGSCAPAGAEMICPVTFKYSVDENAFQIIILLHCRSLIEVSYHNSIGLTQSILHSIFIQVDVHCFLMTDILLICKTTTKKGTGNLKVMTKDNSIFQRGKSEMRIRFANYVDIIIILLSINIMEKFVVARRAEQKPPGSDSIKLIISILSYCCIRWHSAVCCRMCSHWSMTMRDARFQINNLTIL